MSTDFFSWTFPANEHEDIAGVTSFETASHLLDLLHESENLLLMSASRRDWLLSNLEVLAQGFGVDRLAAFHQVRYIIRSEEMPQVIAQVQSLLSAIERSPDECAKLVTDGSSAENIQADFERSRSFLGSASWPGYADDGDNPRYLFSWIKALLQLLLYANANSKCLIHVQPEGQRASDA